MTEKKEKKFKFKGLLIAVAAIVLMMCLLVGADAATGGEVFRLTINGEQVNALDYLVRTYTYTDEDGNEFEAKEFLFYADPEESEVHFSIIIDGNPDDLSDEAIDEIIVNSISDCIDDGYDKISYDVSLKEAVSEAEN